jgi:hypothetical protein
VKWPRALWLTNYPEGIGENVTFRLAISAVCAATVFACIHAPAAVSTKWNESCGTPIEGLEPLIAPGHTLVLGEMHGTREVPAFAASVVCQAAQNGPVVLGLEVMDEPQFETFLKSDGSAQAKQALLSSKFWNVEFQDGRKSVAVFELIDRVRVMKQQGLKVELLLFDADSDDARDSLMAKNVTERHSKNETASFVLVMGNMHARKTKGSPWAPTDGFRPLTSLLAWPLVSLNSAHDDGSAWVCYSGKAEECGPKLMSASESLGKRAVKIAPSKEGAFDGIFDVGSFTASPPAAFPEKAVGFEEKLKALMNGPAFNAVKARRAAEAGDFASCAKMLGDIPNPNADVLYDRACCLSQAKQLDAAFDSLQRALTAGFDDDEQLNTDKDLANLRADARWVSLKRK